MHVIERIISAVPEVPRYLGVDDLADRTAQQASTGTIEIVPLGLSAGGTPLEAVRIGDGRPVVLAYGFPHANEPVGGVALDCLVSILAADPELSDRLDCTLYVIKCVDPDAARRNEGWFRGPYRPLAYALHYYRQPGPRQVEWGFPVQYRTLCLDDPIPEVLALASLIDRIRPDLLFSLHNSNLGGAYYWLMDPVPAAYPQLAAITSRHGLPLHRGEPEHMMALPLAPGVYRWVAVAELYEYFAANYPGDPAALTGMGTSGEEYARERGAVPVMVETPLFVAPVIEDTRPSGVTRRRAALDEIAATRELYGFLGEVYARIEGDLGPASRQASEQSFDRLLDTLDARESHVLRDRQFEREATVAEFADRCHLRRMNRMLPVGMFIRVIEARVRHSSASGDRSAVDRLRAAQSQLLEHLGREAAELSSVEFWATPVRQAVCQQLSAIAVGIDLWRLGALGGS